MRHLILLIVLSIQASAEPFRFHLLTEPHTLNPQSTASMSGNYLYQNIYRGLFRYHSQKGLVKEGAKDCRRSGLKLTCTLNSAHRWSDGSKIKASDYVT